MALRSVEIKHDTGRAVLVRVMDFNLTVWIPRSVVVFPAIVTPNEVMDVDIPRWFMRRELGITSNGGDL